jgi:hypothetical protein
VQTVGSNAEMPRRGLLVDSVIKSGGNDFTAAPWRTGRAGRSRATTSTTPSLRRASGWPDLHTVQDFSGTVGGRIVRTSLVLRRRPV